MEIIQYQIVLVNLEPTIGCEMEKTRPCVVLSPNEMNNNLQSIVIAPITSSSNTYPTRVEIRHEKTKGWIVLDQLRTIDRQRIIKVLDSLTIQEIDMTKSVLKETYVD